MSQQRKTRPPRRTLRIVALLFATLPGCVDRLGTGGTGEVVVPPQQVHDVAGSDLRRYSTAPASTVPTTAPIGALPAPMMILSVEECRASALRNNLDLKVELYNPTIAHTLITQEQAAFEATFNAAANYSQTRFPSAGGVPPFTQYNVTPDASLLVPLQTGGSIKLDAPYQYFKGTYVSQALTSYYTFNPNITFSQPLLRGFGFDINAQNIRLAFYQYQQAQARTKLEVIRVLADTDRAYWSLYASRALLRVRELQKQLAIEQRDRARRQANAGVIADVDIVRAESGVADQEEQILIARNAVRQHERNLKKILNREDLPMESDTQLIPGTQPSFAEFHLSPERLVAAALDQRMELLDTELQIIAEASNIRYARNQMLPLLAVQYTYGHNGYSNSIAETFNQAFSDKFEGHNIGLQLSVPIGNELAKSQLRAAMLRRLQQLATKTQRIQQIVQEIYDTTDTLSTDWQRILAAHERVELARRVVDVEIRQFKLGLRTSTEVLDAQAKLADAESSEIAAITDYQVAQVDIAVATGTVLGASNVHWESAGGEVERSIR